MVDKQEIESEEEEPSFEVVLEKLGALGKFQLTQISFSYMNMFLTACIIMSFVFEGYQPPHACKSVNETELLSKYGLQNDSTSEVVYKQCEIIIFSNHSGQENEVHSMTCPNGRNFFDKEDTTFISQWDLVCESRGVAELSQTIFNLGQMLGGLIGPYIADNYGRKPIFIVSSFLASILEWSIVAAPNIFVVYALKLASGIFYQSLVCTFYVNAVEYITPKHREANGAIMFNIWVLAALVPGAIAYFFRNDSWRYFQGGVGAAGLICLAYPFVLYESPRWLMATGKTEDALRVLEKASKVNGKDFNEVKKAFVAYINHAFPSSPKTHSLPMIGSENHDLSDDVIVKRSETKKDKKGNVLDLIRSKPLRKTTLITWYLFVTSIMTYYGIYMTSSNVAGDRFLNYTLLNLVELPCNAVVYYTMKKWPRRFVLMSFLGLTAISLMTSSLLATFADDLEGLEYASTALFIIGKFFISCAFNVIYIFAPEIFPTNLRSTAIGVCSGFARIGGMAAPFMRPLYHIVKWGPGLIFTIMCLIAVMLTSMLPETKDTDLPERIDEVETKTKNKKLIM